MSRNLCRYCDTNDAQSARLHAAARHRWARIQKHGFVSARISRDSAQSGSAAAEVRPTCRTSLSCWRGACPPLGPSDVASQTARALFSLRESLMRGEFAPGERMSELPLVARLGVSRTPIRLALERLAHMGLLDVSASGGFTVRGYTPSEALDAIEIRGVLEGTAARLASERLVGQRGGRDAAPARRARWIASSA